MAAPMKASVRRVHDALTSAGLEARIVELDETTRTAEEAAAAIGTTVAQIVKSLVFLADGVPIVVLASGVNRVDVVRVGTALGRTIGRASPDEVRAATGFAIGGVAPLGYPAELEVLFDRDLLQHDVVWAAAGTPNAVFPIAPDELLRVSGARLLDIKPT